MSMNNNAKALLFAANPAGTTHCIPSDVNGIPCRTLTYSQKSNAVDRALVKPYFGNNPKAIVGTYVELQIEVELVGGQNNGIATAGAAPYWEPLLLCAGYVVTTTAFNVSAEIQSSTPSLIALADTASPVDGTYDGWTITLALSTATARNQTTPRSNTVFLADSKLLNECKTQINSAANTDTEKKTLIKLSVDASTTNSAYVGNKLIIAGEQRTITAYNGSTQVATIEALSVIPAANTPYQIIDTTPIRTNTLQAGSTLSSIILDVGASATDDFYNGNTLTINHHETIITSYNGTTKAATVTPPLPVKPAVNTRYTVTADSIVSTTKCGSGSSTTAIKLSSQASTIDNFYNGMRLTIGTESLIISSYNAATKTAQLAGGLLGFATAPTSGTAYTITAVAEVERANVVGVGSSTTAVKLDALASGKYQYYAGMRLVINGEMVTIDSYNMTSKIADVTPALTVAPVAGTAYVILYDDDYYVGLPISVRHFSGGVIKNTGSQATTAKKIYLPDLVVGDVALWGLDLAVTHAGITEKRRITSGDKTADFVYVNPAFSFIPDDGDYFEIVEAAKITAFNAITKVATVNKNLRLYPTSNAVYEIGIERIIKSYDGATQTATVTPKLPITPSTGSLYTLNANRTYTLKTPSRTSVLQTGTGYFFIDSVLHSLTKALVNVSVELASGNIPVLKATITGLVDLYQNDTMPYFNRSDYIDAYPVNEANTNTVSLNDFEDAVLEKIAFDTGNKIEYRNMPNYEGIVCNNRAPKGSFNIEATDTARDWFATITNEDKGAVIISHGVTHNRVTLVAPLVQFENHAYGDSQSITMNSLDFIPLPISGNDEFKIVVS